MFISVHVQNDGIPELFLLSVGYIIDLMNTHATIATICQSHTFFPTIEQNRAEILRRLEIALQHHPDLVCLPESFTTPSVPGELANLTEPIPGPTLDAVARLARQHHSYIICPLFTQREGYYWNSAVILGRSGEIVGIYDKVHPVTSTSDYTLVENGISPGSAAPVFDLDFGRIGVQICFDIQFPEGWASLAEQETRLIFWPSAYNGGFPLQAYAWRHHVYIVSAVQSDKSRIIDPLGSILVETDPLLNVLVRDINLDFAVCHYDFNYSIPERIQAAYPDRVEIRINPDASHFLVEPLDPALTVAHLQREFGFLSVQEYIQCHQTAYNALRAGQLAPAQNVAHGNRPMYQKEG
jgi:beta-ureidopropionase